MVVKQKQYSEARIFLKWWGEQFKLRFGHTYMASFAKETTLIKRMLRVAESNEIQSRALVFFDDPDPFLDRAGRTVSIFYTRFNSYVKEHGTTGIRQQGSRSRDITQDDLEARVNVAAAFSQRS